MLLGSVCITTSEMPFTSWKRRWRTTSAIACAFDSVSSASISMFITTCSVCPTQRARTSVTTSTPGTARATVIIVGTICGSTPSRRRCSTLREVEYTTVMMTTVITIPAMGSAFGNPNFTPTRPTNAGPRLSPYALQCLLQLLNLSRVPNALACASLKARSTV